ncbi:MAG: PAS domain S-box protein [Desulfatitalea sp.]|nr:PAS domain S-box protein [Desulfatitalea sp.]
MIVRDLTNNISLIIVLCLFYRLTFYKWKHFKIPQEVIIGILFGSIAVIGMLNPLRFAEGIIFDGRSIVISLAGIFGGAPAAILAAILAGAYRIWIGGAGAMTGVGVIVSSAAIGVLYGNYATQKRTIRAGDFLILGFLVHLCMLAWMLTLPQEIIPMVLAPITIPLLTLYPLATLILGHFLLVQRQGVINEMELSTSREAIETTLGMAAFPIVITSEQSGRILFCNTSFKTRFFGPAEDPIGQAILGIYADPEDRNRFLAEVSRSTANVPLELNLKHASGDVHPSLVTATKTTYRGEAAFVGVITDISEIKCSLDALKKSEERFRVTFERAAIGLANVSLDGRWLSVNRKICEFLGYRKEEFAELTYDQVAHADDYGIYRDQVERLLTGKRQTIRMDSRYAHRDGTRRWGRLTVSLAKGESSGPEYLILFIEDISARKEAENVVQIGEQYFSQIFMAISFGIAQIDSRTGKFERINQTYCDLVGYSQEEIMGMVFQEITHPDDLQADIDNMNLLRANRLRDFSMEKRYLHKNGDVVWVKLTVLPMWKSGDPPSRHIAIIEDITQHKIAEGDLQKHRNHLEELVEERTRDLQLIINTMTDRELRMTELKKEIDQLNRKLAVR